MQNQKFVGQELSLEKSRQKEKKTRRIHTNLDKTRQNSQFRQNSQTRQNRQTRNNNQKSHTTPYESLASCKAKEKITSQF